MNDPVLQTIHDPVLQTFGILALLALVFGLFIRIINSK